MTARGHRAAAGGGRAVCLAVALLVAGLAGGCTEPLDPQARQLLTETKAAYDRGDDRAVLEKTSAFLLGHSNAAEADVAYYFRGLAKYRGGDGPGAISDLKEAFTRTRRTDIRLGATKALGDLAFESGDLDWAEELYWQALQYAEPNRPPVDEIRYRLGCLLQRRGKWLEADRQFDQVLHLFGGTPAAARAARRVRCRSWTIQTGVFSRRDAALAEAKRLREAHLPATTRPTAHEGRLRFHVQVGRYADYAAARAALGKVRAVRKDALCVPTR